MILLPSASFPVRAGVVSVRSSFHSYRRVRASGATMSIRLRRPCPSQRGIRRSGAPRAGTIIASDFVHAGPERIRLYREVGCSQDASGRQLPICLPMGDTHFGRAAKWMPSYTRAFATSCAKSSSFVSAPHGALCVGAGRRQGRRGSRTQLGLENCRNGACEDAVRARILGCSGLSMRCVHDASRSWLVAVEVAVADRVGRPPEF